MEIKAADTDAITGSKQTYTLIYETHEFAAKSRAAAVFVEIRGALAARLDGFLVQTTTQSKVPPAGVFKAELELARDVRDGKVALPILPILYELPKRLSRDGGWKTNAYWRLVNPHLGRSVDEAFLADQVTTAEREGPAKLALIASQHFNVEIGTGQRVDGWAGAEHWDKAADPSITFEKLLELCDTIVIGIDGGALDDLFGPSVVGPCATRRLPKATPETNKSRARPRPPSSSRRGRSSAPS
jgi:phage terminase large subunit-like protein